MTDEEFLIRVADKRWTEDDTRSEWRSSTAREAFLRIGWEIIYEGIPKPAVLEWLGGLYSATKNDHAETDKIVAAGNELLSRLGLFISGNADECANADQPCWRHGCAGTICEPDNYDEPSACDTCGEECRCTRCSDRAAIQEWLRATGQPIGVIHNA